MKQAVILYEDIRQNFQQIMPRDTRQKRGLFDRLGAAIKYVFGNPNAKDLEKINNYLNGLDQLEQQDIITMNQTISVINKICNEINSNTNNIDQNLLSMLRALNDEIPKPNLLEAVITLITQEQHFLNLSNKIKRSLIFSGQLFDGELATHE